jgi:hypothetical protein
MLFDVRQQHRKRIRRRNCENDAFGRHCFATLVAKLGCFSIDKDVADARVRTHRNILDKRIGNHAHSAVDIRPVCAFDGLGSQNASAIEAKDRPWKWLEIRQHAALFEHPFECCASFGFNRIGAVRRKIDTLRSGIHGAVAEISRASPAAESARPFEDCDVLACAMEKICGRKTRKSAANDGDHSGSMLQ